MPGLTLLPDYLWISQHTSAEEFLTATYHTLQNNERSCIILLAHALKNSSAEFAITGCQFTTQTHEFAVLETSPQRRETFWLTLWSKPQESADAPCLELVLSCTSWTLGHYPIFLWTPHYEASLQESWTIPRMSILLGYLRNCVAPERVFATFGQRSLVRTFSTMWRHLTGVRVEKNPVYEAYLTYCTWNSFRDSTRDVPIGHILRHATMKDLASVAQLCKEFADDSIYYPLNIDRANIEARELISKGQMWVYQAGKGVAAICAAARHSFHTSVISKVYTAPKWRNQGFAEHLVRHVTRHLFTCGKEAVVLYVGCENNAQNVYNRVGFVGLCGQPRPEGVQDWLELGFVGTQKGHW